MQTLRQRPLLLVGGVIVLLVLGAVGWWLVSPLFISNVVDEAFPMPSAQELAAMSDFDLDDIRDETMSAAAAMDDKLMEESMPGDSGATIVAQGQFQDADSFHQGSGTATIYQLADGSHVLRFEDFSATNGPDLHVLLTSHAAPTSRDDVMQDYIDLGSLKGNVGSQNYEIPADMDLSQYKSVVIYCLPFHVVFATASLG